MTSKTSNEGDTPTEFDSSAFFTGGFVETTLPRGLVKALDLSEDQAARMYPTWNTDDLEVRMHLEFAEEAGPGVSGRQLKYNSANGSVIMRFPADLSRLTGLERHVVDADVQIHYDVNLEEKTVEISFDPPLTPATVGRYDNLELEDKLKKSGFSPSVASSGSLQSIRYEVPLEYAREYNFEPQKPVGLKLVVVDDQFGIAIDTNPNPDDEHIATRTMNSYGGDGSREAAYAISIPKITVHALRWTLDMPLKAIPKESHIILLPTNPIGEIDGTVKDDELIEELTQYE